MTKYTSISVLSFSIFLCAQGASSAHVVQKDPWYVRVGMAIAQCCAGCCQEPQNRYDYTSDDVPGLPSTKFVERQKAELVRYASQRSQQSKKTGAGGLVSDYDTEGAFL